MFKWDRETKNFEQAVLQFRQALKCNTTFEPIKSQSLLKSGGQAKGLPLLL